jgi:predicted AAA+ superfamily ATPase
MYIERTMSPVIKDISRSFPVLLLTGPRQVGKTTLLREIAEPGRTYVSLDDLGARHLAKTDPPLFLQTYKPPVLIDEAQYAPELFPAIKIYADKHRQDGLVWLTGSQKFRLMEGIQESLAGRVAIINMLGFSYREIRSRPFEGAPFLPSPDWAGKKTDTPLELEDLYRLIWNGSFPKLAAPSGRRRKYFFDSYVQTYIERDVRDFYEVRNDLKFFNFLRSTAARTGTLLNYQNLAGEADVNVRTAQLWLSALERSGLVKLLEPYYPNIVKRMVRTPKMYFLDTGLCSWLCGWDSPQTLERGAMSGAILETWVFAEILKSYWHNGEDPFIYFYRDHDQREIDFIIDRNGMLYPIEVKKTAQPGAGDLRNFKALAGMGKPPGPGALICLHPGYLPLNRDVVSVPVWDI